MKALMLSAPGRLEYIDVPDPLVGNEDVLVEVRACGICGSDIHGMDGSTGRRIPPIIMGHEASGVIRAMGPAVEGWVEGERVTFDSTIYCGACDYCRAGRFNLCDDRRVLGVSCDDYRQHGAFAEYVAVPARVLYRLPDAVTDVQGAMAEPLSIALHAVSRLPGEIDPPAVVVGSGLIGLLLIQSLRARGCASIVAIDVNATRLAQARECGATTVLRVGSDDIRAAVLDLTSGRGASVVFEAVGSSDTVASAVELASKGGSVVLVGNLAPRADLPLQVAVTRELTLYGSATSAGEYPTALEMIAARRVDIDMFISQVAPLSEGAAWLPRLRERGSTMLKVVLVPSAGG